MDPKDVGGEEEKRRMRKRKQAYGVKIVNRNSTVIKSFENMQMSIAWKVRLCYVLVRLCYWLGNQATIDNIVEKKGPSSIMIRVNVIYSSSDLSRL